MNVASRPSHRTQRPTPQVVPRHASSVWLLHLRKHDAQLTVGPIELGETAERALAFGKREPGDQRIHDAHRGDDRDRKPKRVARRREHDVPLEAKWRHWAIGYDHDECAPALGEPQHLTAAPRIAREPDREQRIPWADAG